MRIIFTTYYKHLLNCCYSQKSYSISVLLLLIASLAKAQTVSFTQAKNPSCVGSSITVNITVTPNGNRTYSVGIYDGKTGNPKELQPLGTITAPNSTNAGSGTYTLANTVAGNGRYIGITSTSNSRTTIYSTNSFDIYALPSAPTNIISQTVTYGEPNPALTASVTDGQTINWYNVPTGGEPIATGTTFTSPQTAAGTYTYYAEAQNSSGCVSARTPVTLTINKRELNITATGNNKVYDGTIQASVILTIQNQLSPDKLIISYTLAEFNDKEPGTNKNITVTGIAVNGIDAANYFWLNTTTTSATIYADTDRDGNIDFSDLDDDNDGIPDYAESHNVDAMGDLDGNGIPNYRDPSYQPATYNSETKVNNFFDQDRDGIINSLDLDSDGDGIPDAIEANKGLKPFSDYNEAAGKFEGNFGNNGLINSLETDFDSGILKIDLPDTDKDGLPDFLDLDSDNDGLSDNLESQRNGLARKLPKNADADKDGIDDQYDGSCGCGDNGMPITPVITNTLNGIPDYRNQDSDNDQAPDFVEAYDLNYNSNSLDDLKNAAIEFSDHATTNTAARGYYPTSNLNPTSIPGWLQDDNQNGLFNYLDSGNTFYHDSDKDGWIDLFDEASYADELTPNPAFRQNITIVILPVELVNFKAQLTNNGTRVTWQTAAEYQNDYFLVERSTNGITFETIGKVTGAGTSKQLLSYSFLDEHPVGGINYYRLKQVSLSKQIATSKIVSVETPVVNQVKSQAYPNPSSGNFNLEVTLPTAQKLTLITREATGKIIRTHTVEALTGRNIFPLDLQQVPNGVYLVSILGNQVQLVQRLVKN